MIRIITVQVKILFVYLTGNTVARAEDGNDHGVNEIGSTLHWGPDTDNNRYSMTHGER